MKLTESLARMPGSPAFECNSKDQANLKAPMKAWTFLKEKIKG